MRRAAPRPTSDNIADTITWRRSVLRDAGLDADEARAIASQFDVDVHMFISLVERGLPVTRALRAAGVDRMLP